MDNIKIRKQIIVQITLVLLIASCGNKHGKNNQIKGDSDFSVKEFYENKMKEKNFSFVINGPCDDALEDTIHERSVTYIDSIKITDSNVVVEFKFINACCQEFLGDYFIKNDTLNFQYEQVNDEVCSCYCWYRYKLTINKPNAKFSKINIKEKIHVSLRVSKAL